MKLLFATSNQNKAIEIAEMLPSSFEILTLKDINHFEDVPETSDTIQGNACQKANFIKDKYALDCFADDTGLEIDALGGEPGVYSARYAGEDCNAEDNMKRVLHKLEGEKERSAKFRTVIALIKKAEENLFEGECLGKITETKSGVEGFGYDPIFTPEGHGITFAEMSKQEKGAISHRGRAVVNLVDYLTTN